MESPPEDGECRPAPHWESFFIRWARGWLVLLMMLCFGLVASCGSWVLAALAKNHQAAAAALGGVMSLIVLPVVAHWLFILFFGEDAWPAASAGIATSKEEQAFAQLEQATRLEIRGNVSGALAAYQRVIDDHEGTVAAADAQRSMESLRSRTADATGKAK